MQLQLISQHKEWITLLRMETQGMPVIFAPDKFTHFVRVYNEIKEDLNKNPKRIPPRKVFPTHTNQNFQAILAQFHTWMDTNAPVLTFQNYYHSESN